MLDEAAILFTGFAAIIMACIFSCGHSKHDVKVSGGSENNVTVEERFCDPESYPTVAERRVCKDALLAAMQCEKAGNP